MNNAVYGNNHCLLLDHMKPMATLCGKNVELLIVKGGGTYYNSPTSISLVSLSLFQIPTNPYTAKPLHSDALAFKGLNPFQAKGISQAY